MTLKGKPLPYVPGRIVTPEQMARKLAWSRADRRKKRRAYLLLHPLVKPVKILIPKCPGCGMRAVHANDFECLHGVARSIGGEHRTQTLRARKAWVCPPCPLPKREET